MIYFLRESSRAQSTLVGFFFAAREGTGIAPFRVLGE